LVPPEPAAEIVLYLPVMKLEFQNPAPEGAWMLMHLRHA
jgi:hypothetical protein